MKNGFVNRIVFRMHALISPSGGRGFKILSTDPGVVLGKEDKDDLPDVRIFFKIGSFMNSLPCSDAYRS